MSSSNVKTVCPYCGVGCGMVLHVEDGQVVKISGDKEHPANFGRLCTKGQSAHVALRKSGRLEGAFVRHARDQDPAPLPMAQAISSTAARLRGLLDEHGPDALSFYVSGQMSIEAQYLVNKLAKGFVGTNNIESNSRLCMASAGSGYKLSLGADGPPGSYDDLDHADVFFVIGANMADCHPILFLRMMDRVKAGAKLIVVDPRRNTTAEKADLFMQIKPGTDLALLNGLLHLLHENGQTDAAFIAEATEGWDAMPAFLADYTPENVARITGLPAEAIRRAAQMIGTAKEWISCWTMGPESEHARYVAHQRDLQPASGDRQDLPPRQRAVFADRPAECDGRPRNGLHGSGIAGAAVGAGGGRPRVYRGALGDSAGHVEGRSRQRHDRYVHAHGRGRDQGLLDHLHESGGERREPAERDCRFARRGAGDFAGRVSRHRDESLRRRAAARRVMGRSGRRDDQLGAQSYADAKGHRTAGRGVAGLADHRARGV
ncbi:hypothetical protein GGD41_007027 [Paraburkholderia bryophila]|uniref:4Fe-4S Mo/W bis-MGD-type domain-containing protein n=1 Tax=Paraburkholderia bryophila TaxID=420952 RepID=A0A7Y9WFA6_9BURK|nr:hypothetical protein [Paraburkholderia bryophila]